MTSTAPKEDPGRQIIATNRKARFLYHILETLEAGLVLSGTEVKSLRGGKTSLSDAYAVLEGREVWLLNLYIGPYDQGNQFNHETRRKRKLLLNRREIHKLVGKTREKGLTLVPLRLYFLGGWAKVELALARGKKSHDKRDAIAEREAVREIARAVRGKKQ